jgi:hypothetical protein
MAFETENPMERREGRLARAIEKQTARLPSDTFLWAAGGAMIASAVIEFLSPRRPMAFARRARRGQLALFVGQWVPTLLLLGLYNKIVKVAGSDEAEREGRFRAQAE